MLSIILRAMGRPLNTVTSLELERDFERDWGWRYDGYALVRWPGRMFLEICRRLNCRFYSCTNNFKKFHYGFFFDFNFKTVCTYIKIAVWSLPSFYQLVLVICFLILIWSDWKKESKRHEIFIYTDLAYEAGHMLTPDSWRKHTQITV